MIDRRSVLCGLASVALAPATPNLKLVYDKALRTIVARPFVPSSMLAAELAKTTRRAMLPRVQVQLQLYRATPVHWLTETIDAEASTS